jgi:hypothetical protein
VLLVAVDGERGGESQVCEPFRICIRQSLDHRQEESIETKNTLCISSSFYEESEKLLERDTLKDDWCTVSPHSMVLLRGIS